MMHDSTDLSKRATKFFIHDWLPENIKFEDFIEKCKLFNMGGLIGANIGIKTMVSLIEDENQSEIVRDFTTSLRLAGGAVCFCAGQKLYYDFFAFCNSFVSSCNKPVLLGNFYNTHIHNDEEHL